MGEVVCTVLYNNAENDLVLPDNVPIHLLVQSILTSLALPTENKQYYELVQVSSGRESTIRGSRTLSQAKILNGSILKLVLASEEKVSIAFLVGHDDNRFRLFNRNRIGRSNKLTDLEINLVDIDHNMVVSRNHAMIAIINGHYQIKDNNSKNGTFVNKRRLLAGETAILKQNDIIHFGTIAKGVRLIFQII